MMSSDGRSLDEVASWGATVLVLIIVSAALILGRLCPGPDSASPCVSGVFVVVDDVSNADPSVRSVRACVGGRCERARRGSGQSKIYVPLYRSNETKVVVKVALRDRQGGVVTEDRRRVGLTVDAPNGEHCDPVCFVGQAKVDSHGNLRQVSRAAIQ
jgi:hypothetical protein